MMPFRLVTLVPVVCLLAANAAYAAIVTDGEVVELGEQINACDTMDKPTLPDEQQALDELKNCMGGRVLMRNKAWSFEKLGEVQKRVHQILDGKAEDTKKDTVKAKWTALRDSILASDKTKFAVVTALAQIQDVVAQKKFDANPFVKQAIEADSKTALAALEKMQQARATMDFNKLKPAASAKQALPEKANAAYSGPWAPKPATLTNAELKKVKDAASAASASDESKTELNTVTRRLAGYTLIMHDVVRSMSECTNELPGNARVLQSALAYEPERIRPYSLEPFKRMFCRQQDTTGNVVPYGKPKKGDEALAELYLDCMVHQTALRLAKSSGKNFAKFETLQSNWFLEDVYLYSCGEAFAYTFYSEKQPEAGIAGVQELHKFIDERIREGK